MKYPEIMERTISISITCTMQSFKDVQTKLEPLLMSHASEGWKMNIDAFAGERPLIGDILSMPIPDQIKELNKKIDDGKDDDGSLRRYIDSLHLAERLKELKEKMR